MFDLETVKASVNLIDLIGHDTQLKKITGSGEYAGPCPFCGGRDRFHAADDWWFCRQCTNEKRGDVIAYVMQRDNLQFLEAVAALQGNTISTTFTPAPPSAPDQKVQAEDWQDHAAQVVDVCETTLWADTPQARGVRAWLLARGLTGETLKAWRIGFNPESRKIAGLWVESGITIPYFTGNTLRAINVRRPAAFLRAHPQADKYKLVSGSKRVLFGTAHLAGRSDILIAEGEFDAILVWQEAHDLIDVLTMGSATNVPAGAWLAYMVNAQRFIVATDNDDAGNSSAAKWLDLLGNRATRVTVPDAKDITEYWQHGGNVREWVIGLLPRSLSTADAHLLALLDEDTAHTDPTWPGRWAEAAIAAGLPCADEHGTPYSDSGAAGWRAWAGAA